MNQILCLKCNNLGYYEIGVSGKDERMQMFCACGTGKNLRGLSITWRLNDLHSLSSAIIDKLKEVKDNLHEPDKAMVILQSIDDDLKETIKKCEIAIHEK